MRPREINLLQKLADGQTIKEAAYDLGTTYQVGKNWLKDMRRKFSARTNAHLVAKALRESIIR